MARLDSPLRYPGGKTSLAPFFAELIRLNKLGDCIYAEPYAGGAGAALSLLYAEKVSRVLINDADPRVHAFWWAVTRRNRRFRELIHQTPLTVDQWREQREVYRRPNRFGKLRVGFATFFLNRCNRSGIMVNGGPIGGYGQRGKWKIDARFNREALAERVRKVALFAERIELSNLDAAAFLSKVAAPAARRNDGRALVYLDPPYYGKGRLLYMNYYTHEDHRNLARLLKRPKPYRWVLSYDNAPQINQLYAGFERTPFDLAYTAYEQRRGEEVMIHSPGLHIPARRLPAACA